MAMSCVTRKAAPSSLHRLRRVVLTTARSSTSIISDHHHSFLSMHHFSSLTSAADAKKLSDQKFANLLNSEIEYFNRSIPTKPIDFPFKENQQCWDMFSRNDIPGENIYIQVIRNSPLGAFHWSLEDFQVSVRISKKGGTSITLEFIATADEIIIEKLMVDLLDESTTSLFPKHTSKLEYVVLPIDLYCLRKYLEMRGINRCNIEFLYRYYVRCEERDRMEWLTTLKNLL